MGDNTPETELVAELAGMRVLSFETCRHCGRPRPQKQGLIKGHVAGEYFLVQLYEWLSGTQVDLQLFSLEQLAECRLDDDTDLPWTFKEYDRLTSAHSLCFGSIQAPVMEEEAL